MNEYEDMFCSLSKDKGIKPIFSNADKIMISTESEFIDEDKESAEERSKEEESRLSEEESIKQKRKKLLDELQKYKNIKNPKLQHINKQRADKRKEIKCKIAECDLRLNEINFERGETKG